MNNYQFIVFRSAESPASLNNVSAELFRTGIGKVAVQVPRVRDGMGNGIKFNSRLFPLPLKRTQLVEEVFPWLCRKGVFTGDVVAVLALLLGKVDGVSVSTISRLKTRWAEEHQQWQRRSLVGNHYMYIWADDIYFHIPNQDDRQYISGNDWGDATGKKELPRTEARFRDSELS